MRSVVDGPALAVGVLALATLVSATGATVVAADGYAVTTADSVDTPARTVELDGQSFTVSGIARADPDGALDVAVTAPPDEEYRVYLYNADRRIVVSGRGAGPTTVPLDLAGVDAGTYLLAVQHRGVTEAIHPLVVSGYDVRVASATPRANGTARTLATTVTVDRLGDASHSTVEVVIADENRTRSVEATRDATGAYAATVPVANATRSNASYRLYAVVRGTETVLGSRELLGVSAVYTVRVTDGGVTVTPEPTPPATATEPSPDDTTTPTRTPTSTTTEPPTPRTSSSVLTPATAETTSSRIPGFGTLPLLHALALALALAVTLASRRRSS